MHSEKETRGGHFRFISGNKNSTNWTDNDFLNIYLDVNNLYDYSDSQIQKTAIC